MPISVVQTGPMSNSSVSIFSPQTCIKSNFLKFRQTCTDVSAPFWNPCFHISPQVRCSLGCHRRCVWSSPHTCSPCTCQSQLSWYDPRSPASRCPASDPCRNSFVSILLLRWYFLVCCWPQHSHHHISTAATSYAGQQMVLLSALFLCASASGIQPAPLLLLYASIFHFAPLSHHYWQVYFCGKLESGCWNMKNGCELSAEAVKRNRVTLVSVKHIILSYFCF